MFPHSYQRLLKKIKQFKNLFLKQTKKMNSTKNWIKLGLLWGVMMFIIITFGLPLIKQEEITGVNVLIGIPIWIISGLLFGYIMKSLMSKKS